MADGIDNNGTSRKLFASPGARELESSAAARSEKHSTLVCHILSRFFFPKLIDFRHTNLLVCVCVCMFVFFFGGRGALCIVCLLGGCGVQT